MQRLPLNWKTKNIVTIEDPVEYQIDMINQNQVNEPIGLSFARMLKHILRQDPDIIMVGEIRDRDTAEIVENVGHRPHGAKMRFLADQAKDEGCGKNQPEDERGRDKIFHIRFGNA